MSHTSAIFYFRPTHRKDLRGFHEMWQDGRFVGLVRVELVEGDEEAAMAIASPCPGESVMNTHRIASRRPRQRPMKGKQRGETR